MPGEQEFDTGLGTSGPATMRTLVDTSQLVNPGITDVAHSMPVVQARLVYQYVNAGTAGAAIGAGHVGDYIAGILLIPTAITPGGLTISDGAGSPMLLFNGGTLPSQASFMLPLGIASTGVGWHVTTGGNLAALVVGSF